MIEEYTIDTMDALDNCKKVTKSHSKKMRSRERITKMIEEGSKNYPSYLKLVHTGDSDMSDTEFDIENTFQPPLCKLTAKEIEEFKNRWEVVPDNSSGVSYKNSIPTLTLASPITPGSEKKDPIKRSPLSDLCDDNYFDTANEATNTNIISTPILSPEEIEKQREEWTKELAQLENDILTLRQVLSAKVRQAGELKRKLGITPYVELKTDLKQGLQNIRETDAYQKTNESIKTLATKVAENDKYQKSKDVMSNVGQKTTSALSTVGSYTSTKWSAMRNSASFKSFEERVGGAVTNVKHSRSLGNMKSKASKVRGSQSEQNIEDIMNANNLSSQEMSVKSVPTTPAEETAPNL